MSDGRYKWKNAEQQQPINVNNNIIGQEDQQEENKMPKGMEIYAGKQDLLRTGKYSYFDSKGHSYDASRTTPSSKYMKPVLDSLKAIDDMLSEKCDPINADEMQKLYLDACAACENYLDNRNPWSAEGKARKRMVMDFYAQIKKESILLDGKVSRIKELSGEEIGEQTWLDVLKKIRTQKYVHGQDGVKVSMEGAMSSDVIIVEKNGKKKFFKQSEKVYAGGFSDLIQETLKGLDTSTEKGQRRAEFVRMIESYMNSWLQNDEQKIEQCVGDCKDAEELYKMILGGKDYKVRMTLMNLYKESHDKDGNPVISAEESDYDFLIKQLNHYKKSLFTKKFASNVAFIDRNEEISKRNVATSRIAKFLGLGNLVVKSEMSEVSINGKTMTGITMEEGKGSLAGDLHVQAIRDGHDIEYTPDSLRQLLNLQLLDVICGQTDRHGNNYMAQYEYDEMNDKYILKAFTGIDNDMSFGKITYQDIQDRMGIPHSRIKTIDVNGDMIVPFMDREVAMTIRALDTKLLEHLLVDILSKEERKAMVNRVNGLKKAINKQLDLEAKMKRDNRRFTSKFVDANKDKNGWSKALKKLHQNTTSGTQADKDKYREFITNTTYLFYPAL